MCTATQLLSRSSPRLRNGFVRFRLALLTLSFLLVWASSGFCDSLVPKPVQFSYEIVQEFPHDPEAFTQGLVYHRDKVYEGTGLYGRSSLRCVELQTGKVNRKRTFGPQIFTEGITILEDRIFQLTWKNNLVFVFDSVDFSLLKTWPYPREGWGITNDGNHLIASDGTEYLYFLHPGTMEEQRRISVRDDRGPVRNLNELEYVNGAIYANIWRDNRIAIIEPVSGEVRGYLDLTGLATRVQRTNRADVLNGIMYDETGDRLFVTGKLWPVLYQIRAVPLAPGNSSVN